MGCYHGDTRSNSSFAKAPEAKALTLKKCKWKRGYEVLRLKTFCRFTPPS